MVGAAVLFDWVWQKPVRGINSPQITVQDREIQSFQKIKSRGLMEVMLMTFP